MKSPMKVSSQKTVTKFVLPSPVKATPSISKHGEKGGILMIYLMIMNWKVFMSEISETGEDRSGNIERENKEGERL